jgi:hypothetical protein
VLPGSTRPRGPREVEPSTRQLRRALADDARRSRARGEPWSTISTEATTPPAASSDASASIAAGRADGRRRLTSGSPVARAAATAKSTGARSASCGQ